MDIINVSMNFILLFHGGVAVNFPGFLQPLLGFHYLVGMFVVGMLTTEADGEIQWLVPAVFVGGLVVGAIVGLLGAVIPGTGVIIAVVLVLLGLALITRQQLPTALIYSLIAAFALLYGYAQGLNPPTAANTVMFIVSYAVGLIIATAGIQAAGGLMNIVLQQGTHRELWLRVAGILVAVLGAGLIFTV